MTPLGDGGQEALDEPEVAATAQLSAAKNYDDLKLKAMQEQIKMKDKKPFNHNTPLIKTDMRTAKQSEISKTLEMGPKPVVGNMKRQKRKIISSETQVR